MVRSITWGRKPYCASIAFSIRGASAAKPEYYVPALNVGRHLEKTVGLAKIAEFVHLDLVVADNVHATEQTNDCGHSAQYIRVLEPELSFS
jgi:hypothetical protein